MELELQSLFAFMLCTGTSFFVALTRCHKQEALNLPELCFEIKWNVLVVVTALLFLDPLGRVLHGDAMYWFTARHGTWYVDALCKVPFISSSCDRWWPLGKLGDACALKRISGLAGTDYMTHLTWSIWRGCQNVGEALVTSKVGGGQNKEMDGIMKRLWPFRLEGSSKTTDNFLHNCDSRTRHLLTTCPELYC